VRQQIGFRQRHYPDPRKLDERLAVFQQLVLQRQQPVAEIGEQRPEIPFLLSGVVHQPLAVDQQESDVGTEQRAERVDPALGLLGPAHVLLEPFPRIVVPDQTQGVERPGPGLFLQLDREGVGDGGEAVGPGRSRRVPHAEVVPMQPGPLADVVGDDVEQALLQVLRLLRGSVERGKHDGLAAAALAEHRDVLLQHSAQLHREPFASRDFATCRPIRSAE
jgi:hypothetical protein